MNNNVTSSDPSVASNLAPSLTPSEIFTTSAAPSDIPTINPSYSTFKPSLSPTFRPTISPSFRPTRSPTDANYILSYITTGGVYNRNAQRTNYIINASLAVTLDGKVDNGGDMFTMIPNKGSYLTIKLFNNYTDRIDVSYFSQIYSFSNLNITSGSIIITLPDNQIVKILNLQPSDVSSTNFYFTTKKDGGLDVKTPRIKNDILALTLGILLTAMFIILVLYTVHKRKIKTKKHRRVGVGVQLNMTEQALFRSPVITYTVNDMDRIQKITLADVVKNRYNYISSIRRTASGHSLTDFDQFDQFSGDFADIERNYSLNGDNSGSGQYFDIYEKIIAEDLRKEKALNELNNSKANSNNTDLTKKSSTVNDNSTNDSRTHTPPSRVHTPPRIDTAGKSNSRNLTPPRTSIITTSDYDHFPSYKKDKSNSNSSSHNTPHNTPHKSEVFTTHTKSEVSDEHVDDMYKDEYIREEIRGADIIETISNRTYDSSSSFNSPGKSQFTRVTIRTPQNNTEKKKHNKNSSSKLKSKAFVPANKATGFQMVPISGTDSFDIDLNTENSKESDEEFENYSFTTRFAKRNIAMVLEHSILNDIKTEENIWKEAK